MFLLLFIAWNALCADGAKVQTTGPTDVWLGQCEIVMKEANVFGNFSREVAHGIHSLSLQDIRAFFDKEATPENGVPTVNRDLNSKDEDIILPNAPDIKGEYHSIAMHTFDVGLQNMDTRSYMMNAGILERLSHQFHMLEVWTKSQTFYQDYVDSGVSDVVCDCAVDTTENGIDQALKNIFYYFKNCFMVTNCFNCYPEGKLFNLYPEGKLFNRYPEGKSFNRYPEGKLFNRYPEGKLFNRYPKSELFINNHYPETECGKPEKFPYLENSRTWKMWKEMIQRSMTSDEDLRKFALFMYCALNG